MLAAFSFLSGLRAIRQVSRVILSIALGSTFLAGCYTAEFQAHPDYPGRRPLSVERTEIRETCSRAEGLFLGTLIIRNFQGDLGNPGFRRYIESEMEDRGANFACISHTRIEQQDAYQVQNKSMHSNRVQRGETLENKIGIVKLLLYYNPESEDAN